MVMFVSPGQWNNIYSGTRCNTLYIYSSIFATAIQNLSWNILQQSLIVFHFTGWVNKNQHSFSIITLKLRMGNLGWLSVSGNRYQLLHSSAIVIQQQCVSIFRQDSFLTPGLHHLHPLTSLSFHSTLGKAQNTLKLAKPRAGSQSQNSNNLDFFLKTKYIKNNSTDTTTFTVREAEQSKVLYESSSFYIQ